MSQNFETPAWLDGKTINEVLFCEDFLKNHSLQCVNDRFYGINGTVSDTEVSFWISSIITKFVTTGISRRGQSLLSTLKLFCHTDSIEIKSDEIHLLNGTLYTNGSFSFEKKICIHRLNVTYCPELYSGVYYPEKFLTFLTQLLEPEDILTLQEFMGYCLIPSTTAIPL